MHTIHFHPITPPAMAKSSSALRRLHHLFKQKPKSAAASATPEPSAAPTTQAKYENLVEKFKKKSNSGGFRALRSPYTASVRRLAKAGQLSHVDEILQHQKQYPDIKDEHFAARLITLYGQAKMLDRALQLFDEMPQLNCPRTALSFNALLSACFASQNYDKLTDLFSELPAKLSIEPNAISYTSAIKALCKKGLFDDAVSLLDEMEAKGVHPDAVTFDVLLSNLHHNGRFSEGENVWKLMIEKNVEPNLRCYNARLQGMVSEKRFSEAVELVKQLEENGVQRNSYTYNVMIKGFIKEGNVEEVKKWFAALEESSGADVFTYVVLVPFALDWKEVDWALELCKKSVGLKKKLSGKMVRRVCDELVNQSKIEEAEELLHLYNLLPSQG